MSGYFGSYNEDDGEHEEDIEYYEQLENEHKINEHRNELINYINSISNKEIIDSINIKKIQQILQEIIILYENNYIDIDFLRSLKSLMKEVTNKKLKKQYKKEDSPDFFKDICKIYNHISIIYYLDNKNIIFDEKTFKAKPKDLNEQEINVIINNYNTDRIIKLLNLLNKNFNNYLVLDTIIFNIKEILVGISINNILNSNDTEDEEIKEIETQYEKLNQKLDEETGEEYKKLLQNIDDKIAELTQEINEDLIKKIQSLNTLDKKEFLKGIIYIYNSIISETNNNIFLNINEQNQIYKIDIFKFPTEKRDIQSLTDKIQILKPNTLHKNFLLRELSNIQEIDSKKAPKETVEALIKKLNENQKDNPFEL